MSPPSSDLASSQSPAHLAGDLMRRAGLLPGGGGGAGATLPVCAPDAGGGGKYALRGALFGGGQAFNGAAAAAFLRSIGGDSLTPRRAGLLAVVLLGAMAVVTTRHVSAPGASALGRAGGGAGAPTTAAAAPTTFPAPHLENLVLVAGHAVYTGVDFHLAAREDSWFLEPYQQVAGEAQSFVDHVRLGAELAARDPSSLLLFSGGQTRSAAGPRSEGLSYWVVAEAAGWFADEVGAAARAGEAGRGGGEDAQREAQAGAVASVRARAYTEEHARDSFENLLFGLCRFYEVTGRYPKRVTVVSYTLKERRFNEVHRAALRFPAARFAFVGTPVPPAAVGAAEGEARTVAAFAKDPYGCDPRGELAAKRARRDPFAVGPPHPSRCPAMAGLLRHCGPGQFAGVVPWGDGGEGEGERGAQAGGGGGGGPAATAASAARRRDDRVRRQRRRRRRRER